MKLIIFGPPGSGKGTYSTGLKARFGLEKISTGDMFREEIKKSTRLGKKIENYLREGKLVPDDVVIEAVTLKLRSSDNYILDGYPRTMMQAKALDEITNIEAIININVHEDILLEKITARRICSNTKCDGNYNIADIHKIVGGTEYILPPLLPKNDMRCDKCGSPLIQREDDKPKVIKDRLKVYQDQSKPVIDYYRRKGEIPFIEVWMNRPPDAIIDEIAGKLATINRMR